MNGKLDVWWKLAILSFIVDVLTCPVWIWFGLIDSPDKYPIPLYWVVSLHFLLLLPYAYFLLFCIWHWHVRQAGCRTLTWPILFVVTCWIPSAFAHVPGPFWVALFYFFIHVLPDIRGKVRYANPPAIPPPQASASPLPPKWKLLKSACFVSALALIAVCLIGSIISCIDNFIIWNILADRFRELAGESITKKMAYGLLLAVDTTKLCVVTSLILAIGATVGAALLYASQRMRWRLLEEDEKEKLRQEADRIEQPKP